MFYSKPHQNHKTRECRFVHYYIRNSVSTPPLLFFFFFFLPKFGVFKSNSPHPLLEFQTPTTGLEEKQEEEVVVYYLVMERQYGSNSLSPCSSISNGVLQETVDVTKCLTEANELIEAIGAFSGFRKTQSKECLNLVRRLKMLVPLLEEIRDLHDMLPAEALSSHISLLKEALVLAKRLLKNCHNGSKIYLVNLSFSFSFFFFFFSLVLIYLYACLLFDRFYDCLFG